MIDSRNASDHRAGDDVAKPGWALLMNGLTPYNIHLAECAAREIPELQLVTVFTVARSAWTMELPPQINAVFAAHEDEIPNTSFGQHWSGFRWSDWGRAQKLFETLCQKNVKALVLSGAASLLHVRLLRLAKRAGIVVFLRGDSNIRCDRLGPFKGWLKRRWLGWIIRQCDGVMPMGQFGKLYFAKYGADPQRMFLVPFLPDYDAYRQEDRTAWEQVRQELNLPRERRYFLFGGRLVSIKRVDLLIDAFAEIADKRPDWDLLIAGDGALRESLQARVPKYLADRVRWLGFCQFDTMRRIYHIADVYVLPSDYEPWAVSIAETQAAGLVVVTSDVCGAAEERVIDRVNGRVFKTGDQAALRDALWDVSDGETHRRYREAVRPSFDRWLDQTHPIKGLREALSTVGVLD